MLEAATKNENRMLCLGIILLKQNRYEKFIHVAIGIYVQDKNGIIVEIIWNFQEFSKG